MVQQRSTNLMGGFDTDCLAYSFSGKPLKHKHVYTATGKPVHTEVYTYTYDSAERLKEVYHKLDNQAEVLLSNNTYDELGRLSGKQLHGGGSNAGQFTEKVPVILRAVFRSLIARQ